MEKEKSSGAAIVGFAGMCAVLYGFSKMLGVSYGAIIQEFISFMSGNLATITKDGGFLESLRYIIAVPLIDIVVSIALLILVYLAVGKTRETKSDIFDEMLARGPRDLFFGIFLEELFARALFIGLLASFFGPSSFYFMMVLGNAVWALFHIMNYKEHDRSVIRVMPQFVSGFLYAFIFYKFGFWPTLLAHYSFDVILFTTRKKQEAGMGNLIIAGYTGFLVVIAYLVQGGSNFQVMLGWLTEGVGKVDGFGFWNYFLTLLIVDSLLTIIAEVLLLDRTSWTKTDEEYLNPVYAMLSIFIGVGIILGLNWILGIWISDITTRAVIIGVFVALVTRARTGSAIARVWFTHMPIIFLLLAIMSILGFWSSVLLYILNYIVSYPVSIVKRMTAPHELTT